MAMTNSGDYHPDPEVTMWLTDANGRRIDELDDAARVSTRNPALDPLWRQQELERLAREAALFATIRASDLTDRAVVDPPPGKSKGKLLLAGFVVPDTRLRRGLARFEDTADIVTIRVREAPREPTLVVAVGEGRGGLFCASTLLDWDFAWKVGPDYVKELYILPPYVGDPGRLWAARRAWSIWHGTGFSRPRAEDDGSGA